MPQRRESQPQADDLEDVKKVCVYWPSLSILTVSPVALCNGFPSVTRNQSPRRKRLRLPEGAQRAPCAMIRSSRCGQEWAKGVMWKAEGLLDELISQNVECIMIAFLLSKQSPLEHLSRGQSAHRYVEVQYRNRQSSASPTVIQSVRPKVFLMMGPPTQIYVIICHHPFSIHLRFSDRRGHGRWP